jgi:hypothetical protein
MKILLLLLLFPLALKGQYVKVIEAKEKDASMLYKYAKSFSRNSDRLFISNDGVYDRNWVLGRVKWGNRRKLNLGLQSTDSLFREVTDKVILAYQAKGGCVELMILTGDLTIQCRDGRTRLSLDNIMYAHYNTGAPPTILPLTNSNFKCSATGSLQELQECKVCKQNIRKVLAFTDDSFLQLVNSYEAYLSKTVAEEDW